jgi:N-acetylmuramic acid 6-phosphate etherase
MATRSEELASLITENRNPRSHDIDQLSTLDVLRIINTEDKLVPLAVERELQYIATAVSLVVESFRAGGRLIYVGAGSSGRLGVLDSSECPPTYGTPPEMVVGVIAGGPEAVFRSQEGAEDNRQNGAKDIEDLRVGEKDTVCGIAASRRTPYVVAAVGKARELGARTIYITTNPRDKFNIPVDVAICPEVGPEVIMGSTRMKSGTAQKLILNMITTAAMIRLGKVYENMMVDLQLTNAKLLERAHRIIMVAAKVDYDRAVEVLNTAGGHVKTAIVIACTGLSVQRAKERLDEHNGYIRPAIAGSSR